MIGEDATLANVDDAFVVPHHSHGHDVTASYGLDLALDGPVWPRMPPVWT